jgi:peroxiredoxin
VDDGVVKKLNLEEGGDYTGVSGGDRVLADLAALYSTD